MAQAARLNLRLQKELKFLLTDPPPGASFPLLSSSSSLTTIDAQIKGPEGTVYTEGLFKIKIQIPERYPFQPPSVTFATPIYHPNIDTGGRICLDILNLPPKGAWQPSLNISTVLTSIGLLLSEPNPDDGLMCEASREFKYNRQAFDQKARSMTQKYAQATAAGTVCDTQFQSLANQHAVQVEVGTTTHESKHEADESVVSHKRVIGGSRKLSLESSSQIKKTNASVEGNQDPKEQIFLSDCENQLKVEGNEKAVKDSFDKCNPSQDKLCGSRQKLSLEPWDQFQKQHDNGVENAVPNQCPSLQLENLPLPSSGPSGNGYKQQIHHSQDSKSSVDGNINMTNKKLGQFGNKLSMGSVNASQMINKSDNDMFITSELSSSQSHSNIVSEPLPVAPALDSVKLQPHKDFSDGMGNGSIGTGRKKLCLGGKKLSLIHGSSSEAHGKVNKENVEPQLAKKMLPQSQIISSYPSKSLPMQVQKITGLINQNEAKESAISEQPEAVIVLDSESSDEERSKPLMSKSVLARKRMGTWRIRS